MTKFYVESGRHLKVVVLAPTPVAAILKSLSVSAVDEPLRLADVFLVNERGFVWDREGQERYGDEIVVPTSLLLGEPEEGPAPQDERA
jgi:hypothetical protein